MSHVFVHEDITWDLNYSLTGRVHTRQLSPEFWLRPYSSIWKCFLAFELSGSKQPNVATVCEIKKKKDRKPTHSAGSFFQSYDENERSPPGGSTFWSENCSKTVNAAA